MVRSKFLILLLISAFPAIAQQGIITGTITTIEDGSKMPLPFVNVVIKGTTNGATTDLDGNFSFMAEHGEHVLQVSFVGFEPLERIVKVTVGQTVRVDLELKTQSIALNEVEVVQRVDRERETVLLMDRRNSTALVQQIGAQELKRKGASDVAQGVKKMVGLSTIGERHLVVRGLGDRYNSAYLNGLPLPSPDPDMKVAPLDIFPTDVVGSIAVTKAFTPELFGDFSGGALDIRTKQATGSTTLKVSLGGGMNTRTTFKEFRSYRGGSNDFWGRDDGTRDILTGSVMKPGTLNGERVPFPANFDPVRSTAKPDLNFGLFGGTRMRIARNVHLNVIGTANYSNEHRHREGKVRLLNAENMALLDQDMQSWQFNTSSSALGSASLEFGKRHTVGATALWVNLSTDEHRINTGEHFDYLDDVYARRYTFRQSTLFIQQLHGAHHFGIQDRLTVEWSGSMSTAASDEPDRRQLVYLRDPATGTYRFNAIDRLENHRWTSGLEEEEMSASTSIKYRLLQKETTDGFANILGIHAGAQIKRKERSFGYDIFAYSLHGVNAANPDGIQVETPDTYLGTPGYQSGEFSIANVTGPESDHWIEQDINAAFLGAELDIIPNRLKLLGGARLEEGDQRIIYRRQSDSFYQPMRVAAINSVDLLPYASVKLELNKKDIIRASGSKTLSRPGFREMAPFEYTEFFAGTKNVGNPDLRNGTNYNLDLRFERFPVPGELLAIGVFAKRLVDPIEKLALATASGQLQSFRNTGEANVAGIEFEAIKNLGGLLGRDSTIWNDLSVGMNLALLRSELHIGSAITDTDGADVILTNDVRPLQGASPYLVNFDLTYTRKLAAERKASATINYSVYGPRIFAAGANGLGDQYELPVHTLDLVLSAEIGRHWGAGITMRNLLDARYRIEQETPNGSSIINEYRVGTGISAGISYRIR